MEPQHFGHEHPLSFNENVRQKNYDNLCNMCGKQVSGPNYSCEQCSGLLLHKTCAELPRELQHPLHPKHSLLLINAPWNPEAQCEGCNRGHIRRGFNYYCFDCNFNLDRKCASLPLTVEVESHAHPLTLMRRSVSFTCDACGKQGKGMFYSCAVCPFLVHLECTSFPLMVKLTRHTHPLNLTNPLHKSDHQLCLHCVKNVNTDYMVYYCSTCDFITHLHCAINEELWDTGLDESIDSFPYVVLKSQLGDDKIEKAVEIKHFSHEHDLKFTAIDGQLENNEICDACTWPIYSSFYSCAQCRFFLHKSCVELPRKMSHPLHRHPLILLPEPPYVGKHFSCDACKRLCNGSTYNCGKCMFNLDVQCSLMPDIFNHDGHEHQLILSSASSFDMRSSCDSEGKIFLLGETTIHKTPSLCESVGNYKIEQYICGKYISNTTSTRHTIFTWKTFPM
jgi:hypothetical protein